VADAAKQDMILLGKRAAVLASTNPELIGLTGEIIADGRDTICLRTDDGEKILIKHTITLEIEGRTYDGATLRGTLAARHKR